MFLHEDKHVDAVHVATHGFELVDFGDATLLIVVLGRNEECGASNQRVMHHSHVPFRAVPVEEIDREKERLGEELEDGMNLNEEVHEAGPHRPFNLGLLINESSIGKSFALVLISESHG